MSNHPKTTPASSSPAGTPKGLSRRIDNHVDTKFHLKFMERIYDGAPRWWGELEKFFRPSGANADRLDREPGVWNQIDMAYNARDKFFTKEISHLVACVNPA